MYEIARRTLWLRSSPPREVTVTIGLPVEEPSGEWSCPYRIDGLDGWEHQRRVTGEDAVDALELVLAVVRSALAGSHEAREGLLDGMLDGERAGQRAVFVRWDTEVNAAYIAMKREISSGEAVRQVVAGDDTVLDFGAEGELLGVELLDAERQMPSEMRL
ncbi:DUF2283 domain-containing protein [Nonomuraea sp. NPDC050663]|uniref:DUF2283 domain-containing protein n=1 Tax=Nonomuraea sp. NPDC050663 TaxID=3364370 RepID=UPI0037B70F6B